MRLAPMIHILLSSRMTAAMIAARSLISTFLDTFDQFGKSSERPSSNNRNAGMRFPLHSRIGQLTTFAGVFVLWLLLAGEASLTVVCEGLAVALAVSLWVPLIDR